MGSIGLSPDSKIGEAVWPRLPIGPGAEGSGKLRKLTRGDSLPELFLALTDPSFQLIGVSADELLGNSGPGT